MAAFGNNRRRQRGVAIITALLLTTLAVTIVASLFWQQQVQVRSMENQRLQLQTRWILRGALDWSRLILRQDGADRPSVTALDGVWATPLAETRLDQYIERERAENEKFDATLSGQITDAQARYNLANLADKRMPVLVQQTIFERLLTNLQLDPSLAKQVAQQVANSQAMVAGTDPGTGAQPGAPASNSGGEQMELMRVEDLLAVSGFTPQAIERLRDFVIVLPERTPVNLNTAPPELLAALVDGLSVSEASSMASSRQRRPYVGVSTFTSALQGRALTDTSLTGVSVNSGYFLVLSRVKLDRATLNSQSLIRREQNSNFRTTVVWIRDN